MKPLVYEIRIGISGKRIAPLFVFYTSNGSSLWAGFLLSWVNAPCLLIVPLTPIAEEIKSGTYALLHQRVVTPALQGGARGMSPPQSGAAAGLQGFRAI